MPYLAQRCIVCPVNTVVDELNKIMVDRVPGASKEHRSFDQIANSIEMPSDYELLYPPEVLNSSTQQLPAALPLAQGWYSCSPPMEH